MEWKPSQSRERAKPPIPYGEGLGQVHIATMSKRWAHHLGELGEMSLSLVRNRVLPGLEAASVTVEVHPAQRLAQLHAGGPALLFPWMTEFGSTDVENFGPIGRAP